MARLLAALLPLAGAVSWPCPAVLPSRPSPSNASDVHPAHISVVMAMGDSISAAFAARPAVTESRVGHPMLPMEYRSLAFSGGVGSGTEWTLPFFLQHYNSSLSGYSKGMTVVQTPGVGYVEESSDGLNAALSNSHSWQLLPQVEELVKQSYKIENFGDRWKLLSIFIGANDLCDGMPSDSGGPYAACDSSSDVRNALAERYEQNLRAALTKVRDFFGKVVVQLQPLFSLASVVQARNGHAWCRFTGIARRALNECGCLDREPTPDRLQNLEATTLELNRRIRKVVLDFNLARPDFGVLEQSAGRGQSIPDASFLSALDCFHPSAKAHDFLAVSLWNGLFDRSQAPQPLNATLEPVCPNAKATIALGPALGSTSTEPLFA